MRIDISHVTEAAKVIYTRIVQLTSKLKKLKLAIMMLLNERRVEHPG